MHAIVIADGLSNEYVNPAPEYRQGRLHIGVAESARLFGGGDEFGSGVLPTFLKTVASAGTHGQSIGVIFVRDSHGPSVSRKSGILGRYGEHGIAGSKGAAFVGSIADAVAASHVLETGALGLPLLAFGRVLEDLTGSNPLANGNPDNNVPRFLLVGCHTDKRLLNTALLLRNVLGYPEVAVCPHLVASSNREGHFSALRQSLPDALVQVFPSLNEAASFIGIDPVPFAGYGCRACRIESEDPSVTLTDEQRVVIETLCMHLTRVSLRPLEGGFSGSLLCLTNGWKGDIRTEPMVLKVDQHAQMRRELRGYSLVKDLIGKQIPAFTAPVSVGDYTGIGMELAALEGPPQTLQDSFEAAVDDASLTRFMNRLESALAVLSERLYGNTRRVSWFEPYREFDMHTTQQRLWLKENIRHIVAGKGDSSSEQPGSNTSSARELFRELTMNTDALQSETCICHGDLNLANMICDEKDNVWFIDWTHVSRRPIETDFAKMENDLKFVISKDFELADLPRLQQFEAYICEHLFPGDVASVPEELKFVRWDFRFRKLLMAISRIRALCFALKENPDWLVYRIALLRYATHTLSFDRRRGKGECELPQLRYALASVDRLCEALACEDYHLMIPGQRPDSYPPRQQVKRGDSPWAVPCSSYAPPYHVEQAVLEGDARQADGGWADPEALEAIDNFAARFGSILCDSEGRPLNPAGRTGIAGRGLLGRWGPNYAVDPILTRSNPDTGSLELLLGKREDTGDFSLPGTFVASGETPDTAIERALETKVGWSPARHDASVVFEGKVFDPRQTDHAWVETRACLFHVPFDSTPSQFKSSATLHNVGWMPITADLVNDLFANHAFLVRRAVERLVDEGEVEHMFAELLLEETG